MGKVQDCGSRELGRDRAMQVNDLGTVIRTRYYCLEGSNACFIRLMMAGGTLQMYAVLNVQKAGFFRT